jgi:hypothetical protein
MIMSYFVEKMIEDWLRETDCSSLPGAGKPLNLDEYFSWPEDQRVGLSLLKNAGFVPVEVDLLREISRLNDAIAACKQDETRALLRKQLQEEEVKLHLSIERSRQRRSR